MDDFGDQTIVIGFTGLPNQRSPHAEAWTNASKEGDCNIKRVHLVFRQGCELVLRPPPKHECHRQPAFLQSSTSANTGSRGTAAYISWHSHPRNGLRRWSRASCGGLHSDGPGGSRPGTAPPNHIVRLQLLPDDMAGLFELYGTSLLGKHQDISVSTRWLRVRRSQATTMQLEGCRPTSLDDRWVNHIDGDEAKGFKQIDENICPSDVVQLSYSLNNHAMFRDAQVKSEAWFVREKRLDLDQSVDDILGDIREITIKLGTSRRLNQRCRLSVSASERPYWIFMRAFHHDTRTGRLLGRMIPIPGTMRSRSTPR